MAEPFSKLIPRNKTTYDKGLEQGIEQGGEKAARDMVIALLESTFRSIPEPVAAKLRDMSLLQLRELMLKIPSSTSLEQLFPSA